MGIFKGVLTNLAYMSASRGVYFGFYDSYKHRIDNEFSKLALSYGSLFAALAIFYSIDTVTQTSDYLQE
jgi:hypothetical protein